MMYRVELGGLPGIFSFFDPIVDPLVSGGKAVGGFVQSGAKTVTGVFQKGQDVIESDVVQGIVSDTEDVINYVSGGRQIETVGAPTQARTTLTTSTSTTDRPPRFQTRTSLIADARARQQVKSAKLPLLIGGGVLAAILLLRK